MMSRAEFLQRMGYAAAGVFCGAKAMGSEVPVAVPAAAVDVVNHGPALGSGFALTLDDGPNPVITPRILEELARRKITCTFFMIGKNVDAHPQLVHEVMAAGHEIGNHTYTHPSLNKLTSDRVEWELQQCQDAIAQKIGRWPAWFRPPYGAFRDSDQGLLAMAKHLGIAYWSVDPRDWSKPGVDKIVAGVLTATRPGSIVLLHELHRQTLDALPQILDGLQERGLVPTSITGIVGAPYAFRPAA